MSYNAWDEAEGSYKGPQTPFWALDFSNEEELLKWLVAEMESLGEQSLPRTIEQRKNLAVYRGIQYQNQDSKSRDEAASDSTRRSKSKNPRVVYNHMVDMVEQDVARMTKYRGAVTCTPASEDNQDRITAETAKALIEKFWEKAKIDRLMQKHSRERRIFGEAYIACLWNRNAGPYDNDWLAEAFKANGIKGDPRQMNRSARRKAMKQLKQQPRVPVLDPETGKQIVGETGEPLFMDRPQRRGDVCYRRILAWNMRLQRREDYEDVDYGMFREKLHVDTIKAMHPKAAGKVTADDHSTYFDAETLEELGKGQEVDVWHFYHRSTDMLDQGRYIKFTRTAILINRDNPYLGWDDRAILPWVRTGDIETPAVLNGDATVTHGRGPQAVYNNLISLKVRNRFLFSHPKWMIPGNAVTAESLANNSSIVRYKGLVAPKLEQPAINEANETQMMQEAKSDYQQIMGVHAISRGEPPTGVVAAVALTFLDEQESERSNVGVQNHTETLKQLALHTSWLMADHYGDDPERLEELLGRDKAAYLEEFDFANLRDVGDLSIQNSSALPNQKSARTQYLMDIKERAPQALPDDIFIEMLGLGDVERMRTMVAVAYRKAEQENEIMMRGGTVPAPLEHEYQIAHYRLHRRQLNELSFSKLAREKQEDMKDHTMGHELIMWDVCQRNPLFMQAVMQEFPDFPVFFKPEIPIQAALPDVAQAGGEMLPPDGAMPPPDAMPADMPIGAEAAMPPPEAVAPGAESIMPTGA